MAPLTALTIGSGTLSPDFDRGIYRYTAEVPSDVELLTLDPVILAGFQTDIVKDPSEYVGQFCSISAIVCNDWSYGDGTTYGIVLSDADTNTPGFQVNLDRGENRLLISVNKGPVRSNPPRMYDLTVTVQNSPATGAPAISGTAQVGETLTADTSGISDADGLDNVAYSYQWAVQQGHGNIGRDERQLRPGKRRRREILQGSGHLYRRCRLRGSADQRGDDGGCRQAEHPGHRPANHRRDSPGERDADGGHHGHRRRRRAERRGLQLPVAG